MIWLLWILSIYLFCLSAYLLILLICLFCLYISFCLYTFQTARSLPRMRLGALLGDGFAGATHRLDRFRVANQEFVKRSTLMIFSLCLCCFEVLSIFSFLIRWFLLILLMQLVLLILLIPFFLLIYLSNCAIASMHAPRCVAGQRIYGRVAPIESLPGRPPRNGRQGVRLTGRFWRQ